MKISTRGRYGLKALVDLASREPGECVPVSSIARRQGVSEHYLEQLLSQMKKAGFVESVRGLYGGYKLNMPANQITVADALNVLEGPMHPVECLSGAEAGSCGSAGCGGCPTKPVWEKLYDSINEVLESFTLADLAVDTENAPVAH